MSSFTNLSEVDSDAKIYKSALQKVYDYIYGNGNISTEVRTEIQQLIEPLNLGAKKYMDIESFISANIGSPTEMALAIIALGNPKSYVYDFRLGDYQRMHMVMTGSLIAESISVSWLHSAEWVSTVASAIISGKVEVFTHS
jgi:hypothetical protein